MYTNIAAGRGAASQAIRKERQIMSELTVENIFSQILQLPSAERRKLRRMLDQMDQAEQKNFELTPAHQEKSEKKTKPSLDKRLKPKPMPDSTREFKWLSEHAREYAGQWVALDGDRLIAHSLNHNE
ncbi:MAG: hypothetical protein J2P21_17560, partial [Chloracidobacterium sp.]|nr:hypothetical protein [Chloracidobacterium sp.]